MLDANDLSRLTRGDLAVKVGYYGQQGSALAVGSRVHSRLQGYLHAVEAADQDPVFEAVEIESDRNLLAMMFAKWVYEVGRDRQMSLVVELQNSP